MPPSDSDNNTLIFNTKLNFNTCMAKLQQKAHIFIQFFAKMLSAYSTTERSGGEIRVFCIHFREAAAQTRALFQHRAAVGAFSSPGEAGEVPAQHRGKRCIRKAGAAHGERRALYEEMPVGGDLLLTGEREEGAHDLRAAQVLGLVEGLVLPMSTQRPPMSVP